MLHHHNMGGDNQSVHLGNNAGDHHFNLGNYQFTQAAFDSSLTLPTFNPTPLTMPTIGASIFQTPSAFALPAFSSNTALVFSNIHHGSVVAVEHHNNHTNTPGVDAAVDLAASAAQTFEAPKAHHLLEQLAVGVNALETAHRLVEGYKHDIAHGMPADEALTCNTLSSLAQGASSFVLGSAVGISALAGLETSAVLGAGGVITGNPVLFSGGAVVGATTISLVMPAFESANQASAFVGQTTNDLCHSSFNQARLLARGGM